MASSCLTKIWTGVIKWTRHKKAPGDNVSLVCCEILAATTNLEHLQVDAWPDLLELLLLPKDALDRICGSNFLENTLTVLFKMRPSVELDEFTSALESGMVGCVKFNSGTACFIRMLVLVYTPKTKMYLGLIPHDQHGFMSRLHQLIQSKLTRLYAMKNRNAETE